MARKVAQRRNRKHVRRRADHDPQHGKATARPRVPANAGGPRKRVPASPGVSGLPQQRAGQIVVDGYDAERYRKAVEDVGKAIQSEKLPALAAYQTQELLLKDTEDAVLAWADGDAQDVESILKCVYRVRAFRHMLRDFEKRKKKSR